MQLVHFDFNSSLFEIHDDNHVLEAMKLCEESKGGGNGNASLDPVSASSP
ncbi:hypothetical protein Ccrd_012120 [Cynara cardunculus var. scolymus]|uniref:Transcription factor DP C-terminal domain-containing protein n=1 Tax=Cynara cardunculus var. scolymus TaxID=59895 RepID=A0A103YI12_CYNCS|nr:hypothetical protein Ccrd_012120 [Cynara cardunculus var. scolymus]